MKRALRTALSVLLVAALLTGASTTSLAEATEATGVSQFAHPDRGAIHFSDGTPLSGGYNDPAELRSLRSYFESLNMGSVNINSFTCKGVIKLEVGQSVVLHCYAPIGYFGTPYGVLPDGVFRVHIDHDAAGNRMEPLRGEGQDPENPQDGDYRCEPIIFTAKADGTAVLAYGAPPYASGYYKIIAGTGVNPPVPEKWVPSPNHNDFLTSQALPLGQASVAGKTVKAFYDVFQYSSKYPPAHIGSYENPTGTWYGQPEPDISRLPVGELSATMDRVGRARFEDYYRWEPLFGAWVSTLTLDSYASLLYPWMKGGSNGVGVSYNNLKADPSILCYKWRNEPTHMPGAALAKEHNAIWIRHLGAWMYESSSKNIYGEMVDGWSTLIHPNGVVERGGFFEHTLEQEKEGPGPYTFIPPDVNDPNFPKTLMYIEYTDGSWGYIPLPS